MSDYRGKRVAALCFTSITAEAAKPPVEKVNRNFGGQDGHLIPRRKTLAGLRRGENSLRFVREPVEPPLAGRHMAFCAGGRDNSVDAHTLGNEECPETKRTTSWHAWCRLAGNTKNYTGVWRPFGSDAKPGLTGNQRRDMLYSSGTPLNPGISPFTVERTAPVANEVQMNISHCPEAGPNLRCASLPTRWIGSQEHYDPHG
jgi:hypothetical protein